MAAADNALVGRGKERLRSHPADARQTVEAAQCTETETPHEQTLSGDVKAMFKHFQAELIGKIDFWSQSFSLTGSEKGSDGNFSIMGVL